MLSKYQVLGVRCCVKRFLINAVEYRNKINNALKMHKKVDVLVQTVQLSRTGQHIVFTTTENSNAQKLIEYRKTWENLFEFDEIKVDEK